MFPAKHVLMTGVTSGIGLSLADEIAHQLHRCYDVHFCVTCRNMTKGEALKKSLEKYPVKVTLVEMNVESVKSVLLACGEIKEKFKTIDVVFLNAGIMPTKGLEWKYLFKTLFTSNAVEMFRTGRGLFKTKHHINDEGVNNVFATNVLGHFVLVQQLLPLLKRNPEIKGQEPCKIIWTTSTNASIEDFDRNDFTCNNRDNAYGNSKFILESISVEINKRFNDEGIFSYACNPGTVVTNITGAIISVWVWYIVYPIFWMARLLMPNLTLTPKNSCCSFIWVLNEPTEKLNSKHRFNSCTTFFNRNYVLEEDIKYDEAEYIYNEMLSMCEKMIADLKDS